MRESFALTSLLHKWLSNSHTRKKTPNIFGKLLSFLFGKLICRQQIFNRLFKRIRYLSLTNQLLSMCRHRSLHQRQGRKSVNWPQFYFCDYLQLTCSHHMQAFWSGFLVSTDESEEDSDTPPASKYTVPPLELVCARHRLAFVCVIEIPFTVLFFNIVCVCVCVCVCVVI